MGGWPTTAFLAPDGTTLTGATYLPPEQMRARARRDRALLRRAQGRHRATRRANCARRPTQRSPERARRELRDGMIVRAGRSSSTERVRRASTAASATRRSSRSPKCSSFCSRSGGAPATQRLLRDGGAHDAGDGARRHVRSRRGRILPVFDDARLVGAALREDGRGPRRPAARPRAASRSSRPTDDFRATLTSARRATCATCCATRAPDSSPAAKTPTKRTSRCRSSERRAARGAVRRPHVVHELDVRAGRRLVSGGTRARRRRDARRGAAHARQRRTRAVRRATACCTTCCRPGGEPQVRGLLTDQVGLRARAARRARDRPAKRASWSAPARLAEPHRERFEAADGGFYDRLAMRRRASAVSRLPTGPSSTTDSSPSRCCGSRALTGEAALSGTRRGRVADDLRSRTLRRRRLVRRDATRARCGATCRPS